MGRLWNFQGLVLAVPIAANASREAAIVSLYGSVQNYLDNGVLVGMPLQDNS